VEETESFTQGDLLAFKVRKNEILELIRLVTAEVLVLGFAVRGLRVTLGILHSRHRQGGPHAGDGNGFSRGNCFAP